MVVHSMTHVISCPHCEARFKVSPVLVDRAVRCSQCKAPFRISVDGSSESGVHTTRINVTKTLARTDASKARLSANPGEALEAKRNTKVEQAKKSMQLAVESATKAKLAPDKQGEIGESPRKSPAKSGVVRTNSGNKQQQKALVWMGACLLSVLGALSIYAFTTPNMRYRALSDFTVNVGENQIAYPFRIPAYQSRFAVRSRNGMTQAPVILNVDRSEMGEAAIFDWESISLFVRSKIGDMNCNRQLGFYYFKKDEKTIQDIGIKYLEHDDALALMYQEIQDQNIHIVYIKDLLKLLRERDIDERLLYVVSVFLATTEGQGYLLGDAISSTVQVCTFSGKNGQVLYDKNGIYDTYSARAYEGVLVNFPENAAFGDNWKILDVCVLDYVESIYQPRNNPLAQQSNCVSLTRDAL